MADAQEEPTSTSGAPVPRWRKGRLILVAHVACAQAGCLERVETGMAPGFVEGVADAAMLLAGLGWGLDEGGGWVCPAHRPPDDGADGADGA